MGMRGPAPKPTSDKVLRGNPGKRALNLSEPEFSPAASDPKPSAKLTGLAKRLWREKVAAIGRAGIKATDIPALTMLVQAESRAFDLAQQIDAGSKDGEPAYLVKTGDNMIRANPLFALLEQERRTAMSLWNRFGHTPADRSRIMEESSTVAERKKSGILSGDWKPKASDKTEATTETVQ